MADALPGPMLTGAITVDARLFGTALSFDTRQHGERVGITATLAIFLSAFTLGVWAFVRWINRT